MADPFHTIARRRRRRPASAAAGGFTLVELMISIALVVLLILGVNQVFLYTSQAVGTGEAINDAVRNSRSIQNTLGDDLAAAVPNGLTSGSSGAFVITSSSVYAFRDAKDQAGDRDANPATYDIDADGTEGDAPGETISPVTYSFRNHRIDTVSFFARGHFPRQTGGLATASATDPFVANQSATEAWVWYGHLQLPDNTSPAGTGLLPMANFAGPGQYPRLPGDAMPADSTAHPSAAVNPNNIFASQFVLGRQAILLRPTEPTTPGIASASGNWTTIYDNFTDAMAGKNAQAYIGSKRTATGGPAWPIAPDSQQYGASAATTPFVLPQSRYDLAAGSIPSLQATLTAYINAGTPTTVPWWSAANYTHVFECNPFVTKPLSAPAMAQASPYFLRGCSQFTVEFAGDFVTQNNDPTDTVYNDTTNTKAYPTAVGSPSYPADYPQAMSTGVVKPTDGTYGDVIADGPDGVVDFVVDKSADKSAGGTQPWLWQRRVRWYGLPRDDNGLGKIPGWAGTYNTVPSATTPTSATQSNNSLLDVVPVRDVVLTTVHPELLPSPYVGESFEHFPDPGNMVDYKGNAGSGNNPIAAPMTDYSTITPSTPSTGGGAKIAAYTAAFGPYDPRVRLVRITITLDDPNGRLRDGQTYQYVFAVGGK